MQQLLGGVADARRGGVLCLGSHRNPLLTNEWEGGFRIVLLGGCEEVERLCREGRAKGLASSQLLLAGSFQNFSSHRRFDIQISMSSIFHVPLQVRLIISEFAAVVPEGFVTISA